MRTLWLNSKMEQNMELQSKEIVMQNITTWPEIGINYWGINKVATSSLMAYFISATSDIPINELNQNNDQQAKIIAKKQKRYIDNNTAYNNGCKNLVVVRNPYDRIISCYRMFKYPSNETQKSGAGKARFDSNWNENEFLNHIENQFNNNIRGNKHYAKQITFVPHIDKMDYVIKLEEIFFQWPLSNLPKFVFNKSDKQEVNMDIDRVKNLYKEDYKMFGY